MGSKFDWSICVARIYMQFIHRDIFQSSRRFSLGLLVMLLVNFMIIYGCCYTICSYEVDTAFNTAIVLGGVIQVRTIRS